MVIAKGYGISFWSNEDVLKLIVVIDAQHMNTLKAIEPYTLIG